MQAQYLLKMSLQPILLSRNGMNHCFKLNNDDFEKFNKVLKKRERLKISKNANLGNLKSNLQEINEKITRLERIILQRIKADERAGRIVEDLLDI